MAALDDRAGPLPGEKAAAAPAAASVVPRNTGETTTTPAVASSGGSVASANAGGTPAPPAAKPIDPNKPGTRLSGRWQYTLQISDPGTPAEGRSGWLFYDGRKLPLGQINDYYRTPWGPIYWVGVPQTQAGLHGWMSFPSPKTKGLGRELPLPAVAVAPRPAPRSPWFEIAKADSGKHARVPVGQYIFIRLPGNPTTGFQWRVGAIAGVSVRLLSEPQYVPPASSAAAGTGGTSSLNSPAAGAGDVSANPAAVGAGGTYYFKFRAVAPGTTKIKLIYAARVGEGPAAGGRLPNHRGGGGPTAPAAPCLNSRKSKRCGAGLRRSPAAASRDCESRG